MIFVWRGPGALREINACVPLYALTRGKLTPPPHTLHLSEVPIPFAAFGRQPKVPLQGDRRE